MKYRPPGPHEQGPDGIPSVTYMEGELEKLEAELEARRGQVDKALSIFSRAKVALVELSEQQKKLESLRERVARVITTVLTR